MEVLSHSEIETEQFGAAYAKALRPGDVVLLLGPLGAGKTAFVRGALRGLGYEGRVTSPTYALVNEYASSPPVFHFDLYRLSSGEELYDIGFDEYLSRGGISFVEWGERAEGFLPAETRRVRIEPEGGETRRIRTEGME